MIFSESGGQLTIMAPLRATRLGHSSLVCMLCLCVAQLVYVRASNSASRDVAFIFHPGRTTTRPPLPFSAARSRASAYTPCLVAAGAPILLACNKLVCSTHSRTSWCCCLRSHPCLLLAGYQEASLGYACSVRTNHFRRARR